MGRLSYTFQLLWRSWWRVVYGVWGMIAIYDTIFGQFFPRLPTILDWWSGWHWGIWVIIALLLVIAALIDGSYRSKKRIEKERDELLNVSQQNGVIVIKHPPQLVIGIGETLFGVSGDNGFPLEGKARWIRLTLYFRGNVFVETLGLVISGKTPISAYGWKPGETSPVYYYFQIPDWVKSKEERTIQVQAFANGKTWGSPEMSINFSAL